MSLGIDSVRVNSTTYAWSSSIFLIDGVGIEGIVSVDYEEKREVDVVHAARQDGRPVAWAGSGKYSVPSFKVKMLKDTFADVQAMLAVGGMLGPGLGSYGDAIFTFQLQCVEPLVAALPITTVAAPCRITGKREAREEGIAALMTELDISCLQLIENGIPLWSLVRSLI